MKQNVKFLKDRGVYTAGQVVAMIVPRAIQYVNSGFAELTQEPETAAPVVVEEPEVEPEVEVVPQKWENAPEDEPEVELEPEPKKAPAKDDDKAGAQAQASSKKAKE